MDCTRVQQRGEAGYCDTVIGLGSIGLGSPGRSETEASIPPCLLGTRREYPEARRSLFSGGGRLRAPSLPPRPRPWELGFSSSGSRFGGLELVSLRRPMSAL